MTELDFFPAAPDPSDESGGLRMIESRDPSDPRDRGYRIVVQPERGRWFANCRVDSGRSWRGRYGPTPEEAERKLRDWIEASG